MIHYQQKLPPDSFEKIYDFIKECLELPIYYQIDENIDLIANVDQTPILMEFKIENGEKEVRIKTFNLDQNRFSLVLCVTAWGTNYLYGSFQRKSWCNIRKKLAKIYRRKKL